MGGPDSSRLITSARSDYSSSVDQYTDQFSDIRGDRRNQVYSVSSMDEVAGPDASRAGSRYSLDEKESFDYSSSRGELRSWRGKDEDNFTAIGEEVQNELHSSLALVDTGGPESSYDLGDSPEHSNVDQMKQSLVVFSNDSSETQLVNTLKSPAAIKSSGLETPQTGKTSQGNRELVSYDANGNALAVATPFGTPPSTTIRGPMPSAEKAPKKESENRLKNLGKMISSLGRSKPAATNTAETPRVVQTVSPTKARNSLTKTNSVHDSKNKNQSVKDRRATEKPKEPPKQDMGDKSKSRFAFLFTSRVASDKKLDKDKPVTSMTAASSTISGSLKGAADKMTSAGGRKAAGRDTPYIRFSKGKSHDGEQESVFSDENSNTNASQAGVGGGGLFRKQSTVGSASRPRSVTNFKSMMKSIVSFSGSEADPQDEPNNNNNNSNKNGVQAAPAPAVIGSGFVYDPLNPNLPLLLRPKEALVGQLSKCYTLAGVELFEQSLELSLQVVEDLKVAFDSGQNRNNGVELAQLLDTTADMFKSAGRLEMAAGLLTDACTLRRNHSIGNKMELASSLNDLALIYLEMKQYKDALDSLQDSFNMLNEFHGGIHADIAASLGNIGVAYRGLLDYPRAIASHEKAIKMMDAIAGKEHNDSLRQKAQLGITLAAAGDSRLGTRILRMLTAELETRHKQNEPFMRYLSYELKRINNNHVLEGGRV